MMRITHREKRLLNTKASSYRQNKYRVFLLSVAFVLLLALGTIHPAHTAPLLQEGDNATLLVVNDSEKMICFVGICPLDAERTEDCIVEEVGILPGTSLAFDVIANNYNVVLGDCDGNILLTARTLSIVGERELRFTVLDPCTDLNQEGMRLYRQAQYHDALLRFQESLACYREIGGREGEGNTLLNIGAIYARQGEYAVALDSFEHALVIFREIEDREGEGITLNHIGVIYDNRGQYAAALDYYEQALVIHREIGNQEGEGNSLHNIGSIYARQEQYTAAMDYYEQALIIRREIGDRDGEGDSLHSIGTFYDSQGQYIEALDYFEQALAIRREIGDRDGEGGSLNNIGSVYLSLGEYTVALDYFEQALIIHREIGDREGEGLVD